MILECKLSTSNAFTGKVICIPDPWAHDLQNSRSAFFDHIWSCLGTWPLTSKSNQFILVPNCTQAVNLVKFPRLVVRHCTHKVLASHTDTRTCQKQNAFGVQSPEEAQKLWASCKGSVRQHSIYQNDQFFIHAHTSLAFGGLAALYITHL